MYGGGDYSNTGFWTPRFSLELRESWFNAPSSFSCRLQFCQWKCGLQRARHICMTLCYTHTFIIIIILNTGGRLPKAWKHSGKINESIGRSTDPETVTILRGSSPAFSLHAWCAVVSRNLSAKIQIWSTSLVTKGGGTKVLESHLPILLGLPSLSTRSALNNMCILIVAIKNYCGYNNSILYLGHLAT